MVNNWIWTIVSSKLIEIDFQPPIIKTAVDSSNWHWNTQHIAAVIRHSDNNNNETLYFE